MERERLFRTKHALWEPIRVNAFSGFFRTLSGFWELELLKFQVLFLPAFQPPSWATVSLKGFIIRASRAWESQLHPKFPQLRLRHADNAGQPAAHTSSNNWVLPLPGEEQHPLRWEEMHPEECRNSSGLFTQEMTLESACLLARPPVMSFLLTWGGFTRALDALCGSDRFTDSSERGFPLLCASTPIWIWVSWCCSFGEAGWLCSFI